jgi:hypothetical protein
MAQRGHHFFLAVMNVSSQKNAHWTGAFTEFIYSPKIRAFSQ